MTARKTANSERYHFDDFTTGNYRALLRLAKARYPFRDFSTEDRDGEYVIWRHDIDFSPQSARRLARIEHEEGVSATYFVLLHSEFYNPLEPDTVACLRDIVGLGHQLGLHFDPCFEAVATVEELERGLAFERLIVERIGGAPIGVFSFHNPTAEHLTFDDHHYAGLVNTYARTFKDSLGYCSDSNGYWRHRRLEDVLRSGEDARLQVLTHPVWWQDTVMSPRERVWRCIDGRADRTKRFYDELLRQFGRDNLDWD